MILAGQLLIDEGAGRCSIQPGMVRLEDDVIAEIELGQLPGSFDVGGADFFLSPGFIDAHLHLPQFDLIGAHGLPLLGWLNKSTFPSEIRWSDPQYAAAMTRRVVAELMSFGTTGIAAYATVHFESARAALQVASDAGTRGVIGQTLIDRNAPNELTVESNQLLDEAEKLQSLYPASGRMAAAVTPRYAVACSEALLDGAGQLSEQSGAMVQSHLAETPAECEWIGRLFGGKRYVEVYRDARLMHERSVYGHGIHLDSQDHALLQDASAIIAHCPTANSFLRSGTMNRRALLESGVKLTIGSDIGAGYERSMVRVARAMIEAASMLGDSFPSASEAWHAITAGNADMLGWSDVGRLRVGGTADLVVVEPTIRWLDGGADPLSMLMFAWDDRWIKQTFVRGKASYQAP